MADVTLQARVDTGGGLGAPQVDAIVINPGDEVQFSAPSFAGWTSPAAYFQFSKGKYPPDWPCPDGWDEEDGNYRFTCSNGGGFTPPTVAFPMAGGIWGKWRCILVVNGGGTGLEDELFVEIVGPNGTHDIVPGEAGQFDEAGVGYLGPQRENLRIVDDLGDVVGDAAVAATPNKLALRGASGEAGFGYLDLGTGTKPTSGLLRGPTGQTWICALTLAGGFANAGFTDDGADGWVMGNATRAAKVDLATKTGGYARVVINTVEKARLDATGINIPAGLTFQVAGVGHTTAATPSSLSLRGTSGELTAAWFTASTTVFGAGGIALEAAGASLIAKAAGAGVGDTFTIRGANGAVGFAGGPLSIGPGIGGTPDSNAPGLLSFVMGSNGTNSGQQAWTGGSLGQYLALQYLGATSATTLTTTKTTLALDAATSVKLAIGGTTKATLTTNRFDLASGSVFSVNNVNLPFLSSATPQALGAAAAGVGTATLPDDHVHPHGNLATSASLYHALAVAAGNPGFMSGMQAGLVDNATSLATASTLAYRGSSKELELGYLAQDSAVGPLPSVGFIRVAAGQTILATREAASPTDHPILVDDGANSLVWGSQSVTVTHTWNTKAAGQYVFNIGGNTRFQIIDGAVYVGNGTGGGGDLNIGSDTILTESAGLATTLQSALPIFVSTAELTLTCSTLGLYNASPVGQQTVTGSRASGAALASLLTKLALTGIIVDGSSA